MLLKSYKVKSEWDAYKQDVLQDVLHKKDKKKHKDSWDRVKGRKSQDRQDDILLSVLRRAQIFPEDENPINIQNNQTVLILEEDPDQRHRKIQGRKQEEERQFEYPVVHSGPLLAKRRSTLSIVALSPKSSLVDTTAVMKDIIIEEQTSELK